MNDFNLRKPPLVFKKWLDHHLIRDSPIRTYNHTEEDHDRIRKLLVPTLGSVSRTVCVPLQYSLNPFQINQVIIFHRNTALPKLGMLANVARTAWADYTDAKYYDSIESLEKHLLKAGDSIDDQPDWVILSVWLAKHMLKWRTTAQNFELNLADQDFREHHRKRIAGSRLGPLMTPATTQKPEVQVLEKHNELAPKIVEILDLLSLTGYNWAAFHNKSSLVIKWVKIAMASMDIRLATYLENIFQDRELRPLFRQFTNALRKSSPENKSFYKLTRIPGLKPGAEPILEPVLHSGFFHPNVAEIDQNLARGLVQLKHLVDTYGTLNNDTSMSTNVMKGYHMLAMVYICNTLILFV